MRKISQAVLAVLALLVGATAQAQEATNVTGRVTGAAQAPLENVAVSIPELRVGSYTDQSGRYQISVPATAAGRTVVIVARRIGYQPDSARVTVSGGAVSQDFSLAAAPTQLTGVVVTAGSVVREKSTLGTAQQQLSTEDITTTKTMNVMEAVAGKVSGVTITGSGTPGGSTNFLIRGANTFASNNQPLFIVDGIPVSNANRGGGLANGYDFGNAISDINPEDIETLTVLKGPNAAAIYGSRAQNGAVIITTKKGLNTGGRMRTELSAYYSWEGPGRLPEFQNQYGQGAGGDFLFINGAGAGNCDGCDQSWGPKLDGRLIHQFTDGADTSRKSPWIAHPDNVKDFFETGHTASVTASVSGGTERANARMSVGFDNTDGYVPNNSFQKATGLLSGALQVNSKFSTNAVLQYVRNNGQNRPGTGYNNSILEQFFWFGRQVDIDALRNWQQGSAVNGGLAGREFSWNYNYHNNPFYIQEANDITDTRDRFIVQGSATYKFTDWLSTSLRTGSDIFRLNVDQKFDAAFLNGTYVNPANQGGFAFFDHYRNEHNTELTLNANHNVTPALLVNAMLGGNIRREYFDTTLTQTTGLSLRGIYNVSNAAITPTLVGWVDRRNVNSVYGSAAATWNGFWTVEGTARQDVSSTLPKEENTYFYPSLSTSLILTEALPAVKNRWLSYLKLRASVAQVGNDASAYQLTTTYTGNANKFGGRPQFTRSEQLLEPNLKPEITRSNEAGLEASFLDGRASFDLSLYDKNTRNQIYLVPISSTAGYAQKLINAGKMSNKGIEALLSVTPVQTGLFSWSSTFNYASNRNRVEELAPGVNRILLGNGLFGDVQLEARPGQPYGAIWGYGYARDANRNVLIEDGYPILTDTMIYLGSIQPAWTGGFSNTFTYRNVSLGVLLDVRRGGKVMSYTNYIGDYSGVLKSSLHGREVDWDNPGVVARGIDVNTGQPNTVRLTAEQYFQGGFFNVEPYVYDASYTKLREIRLGFDVPPQWLDRGRMRFQAMSIALTGRNLAMWTSVPNVDPEFAYSSGNFQGIEYAFPGNTRSFGINVRITP